MSQDNNQDSPPQGVTVSTAAGQLGITVDAVRKRIQRGTLEIYRVDKRVYVVLDAVTDSPENPTMTAPGPVSDTVQDIEIEYLKRENQKLEDNVAELSRRLDTSEQAQSELRLVIARLSERIPELPATTAPTPTSERVFSADADTTSTPDVNGQPEQSASAWHRFWRFVAGE